jgi:hypothetical protein
VTEAPSLADQLRSSCEASGVPLHVEDAGTLRRVLGLLLVTPRRLVASDSTPPGEPTEISTIAGTAS